MQLTRCYCTDLGFKMKIASLDSQPPGRTVHSLPQSVKPSRLSRHNYHICGGPWRRQMGETRDALRRDALRRGGRERCPSAAAVSHTLSSVSDQASGRARSPRVVKKKGRGRGVSTRANQGTWQSVRLPRATPGWTRLSGSGCSTTR